MPDSRALSKLSILLSRVEGLSTWYLYLPSLVVPSPGVSRIYLPPRGHACILQVWTAANSPSLKPFKLFERGGEINFQVLDEDPVGEDFLG